MSILDVRNRKNSINYMKTIYCTMFTILLLTSGLEFAIAQYYPNYPTYTNSSICTKDAMVCPDGSVIGRSGPNCNFICPNYTEYTYPTNWSGYNIPYNSYNNTYTYITSSSLNSYQFAQGCNLYNFDTYTKVATLVGSYCTSNYVYPYNTQYSPTTIYPTTTTYPASTIYPTTTNYTYKYINGSWYPSNLYNDSQYYTNYNTQYNPTSPCYYLNGYQVCY